MAVVREDEADEHGDRAEQVAAEVERVRGERRALVAAGGSPGDDHAAQVDRDHDAEDDERVPGHVHVAVRHAGEALDRPRRDEEADEREEAGLRERRQVLRLAVTELVRHVRGAGRDPDGEVREQRGDEVGARVGGLGDEAEAVRREADGQLQDDEDGSRGDREERRAALWRHVSRRARG